MSTQDTLKGHTALIPVDRYRLSFQSFLFIMVYLHSLVSALLLASHVLAVPMVVERRGICIRALQVLRAMANLLSRCG